VILTQVGSPCALMEQCCRFHDKTRVRNHRNATNGLILEWASHVSDITQSYDSNFDTIVSRC